MNDIIACVFPETLPDEALLFPLVQVFGQLVYMQAVEDEPLDQDRSTPFIEQLLRQGTLQLHTPMPLGDQRQRFLALTGDIKNRRDDYASQLSMLSLAGLSRREQQESKNSILTELLHSGKIAPCQEEEEQVVWQSRLLLKLGEFFDTEQADLDSALRMIASRQDALLAALREEEDILLEPRSPRPAAGFHTDGILQHRLKAWSRLYFHETDLAPPPVQVFITGHTAAFDILQEVFEKHRQQSPRLLVSLELPARGNSAGELVPPSVPMHHCTGLQTAMAALTDSEAPCLPQGQALSDSFTESAAVWSQFVDTHYPAATHARCRLDLFLFPGLSARQLFLETFSAGNLATDDRSSTGLGTLVGLLTTYPKK